MVEQLFDPVPAVLRGALLRHDADPRAGDVGAGPR